MRALAITLILALAACERQDAAPQNVQRVELDSSGSRPAPPDPSPDTSAARWTVSDDGQAIRFGNAEEAPLMSLACDVEAEPPQLVIIRHARAYPGQGALFPVIGNGMTSRFLVDAVLADGEWHWEARLPADDPQLEVFGGTRDLIATLPGRGMLEIEGSRITGEFVEWCRAGGTPDAVESDIPEDEAEGEPEA